MRSVITSVAAIAALAALAACDNGARAVSPQIQTARAEASPSFARTGWAASKAYAADEAAQRQFEKNGAALGATSVDDYVAEAKAFIAKPPKGVERITRPNGDVLLYDASSNRFAVATADGQPRTLFKPREGAAYWAEQKSRAASSGKAGRTAKAKSKAAPEEG
jgi:pyocin large subunit-like protein